MATSATAAAIRASPGACATSITTAAKWLPSRTMSRVRSSTAACSPSWGARPTSSMGESGPVWLASAVATEGASSRSARTVGRRVAGGARRTRTTSSPVMRRRMAVSALATKVAPRYPCSAVTQTVVWRTTFSARTTEDRRRARWRERYSSTLGFCRKYCSNSGRRITSKRAGRATVTVAVRGLPSSSAISPTSSPGCRRLSSARPSGPPQTSSSPLARTKISLPSSPARQTTSPRSSDTWLASVVRMSSSAGLNDSKRGTRARRARASMASCMGLAQDREPATAREAGQHVLHRVRDLPVDPLHVGRVGSAPGVVVEDDGRRDLVHKLGR
jgi:hypothetical protein